MGELHSACTGAHICGQGHSTFQVMDEDPLPVTWPVITSTIITSPHPSQALAAPTTGACNSPIKLPVTWPPITSTIIASPHLSQAPMLHPQQAPATRPSNFRSLGHPLPLLSLPAPISHRPQCRTHNRRLQPAHQTYCINQTGAAALLFHRNNPSQNKSCPSNTTERDRESKRVSKREKVCVCVCVCACMCVHMCMFMCVCTWFYDKCIMCVLYCSLCKISLLITDLIITINTIVPLFCFLCISIFTFITYFSLNKLYIL